MISNPVLYSGFYLRNKYPNDFGTCLANIRYYLSQIVMFFKEVFM